MTKTKRIPSFRSFYGLRPDVVTRPVDTGHAVVAAESYRSAEREKCSGIRIRAHSAAPMAAISIPLSAGPKSWTNRHGALHQRIDPGQLLLFHDERQCGIEGRPERQSKTSQ